MTSSATVDLCSDDETGMLDAKDIKKDPDYISRKPRNKRNRKEKTINNKKSPNRSGGKVSKDIKGQCNSDMLDQEDSLIDDSRLSSTSNLCPAPIYRQFWKAGNYDIGRASKATLQNGKNHLRVHPMFLHSNATSHKWAFGAMAELLDNAIDEIQNGATSVVVDKITNPRDGSPALLIQDDGGGMNPETIRRCMSFGFSEKNSKSAIGQYGNGFKTSSMRLGADVIVFSRHLEKRTLTQSVGLLSYTFLRQTGHDRIVVPLVDYEFNTTTKMAKAIHTYGEEHFSSNLSILLKWSPYSTEENLLKEFDTIGHHGTKIIIYNLWFNEDGDIEMDFDADPEDIRISGDQKLFQKSHHHNPKTNQHMAHQYRYSLRIYASILYLRIPENFKIILRGRVVEHHNIANDLIYPEFILYRPGGSTEAAILTTIGFLKEAPHVNIHGFNVYHRNRLILPFWRVVNNTTWSDTRGVVGVLEANFVEPTHNKQDFEKTSLFQKLEARLKQMTFEYWDTHCGFLGYHQAKKPPSVSLPSQESLSPGTRSSPKQHVSMNPTSSIANSPKIASIVGPFHNRVSTSPHVSGSFIKRKNCPAVKQDHAKRQALSVDSQHNQEEETMNGDAEKQWQDEETTSLMQENKNLRSQLSELEKREEELNQKVKRLRNELEDVQHECTKLLAESKSFGTIKEENVKG